MSCGLPEGEAYLIQFTSCGEHAGLLFIQLHLEALNFPHASRDLGLLILHHFSQMRHEY